MEDGSLNYHFSWILQMVAEFFKKSVFLWNSVRIQHYVDIAKKIKIVQNICFYFRITQWWLVLGFLTKKYLSQISILGTNQYKNSKIKGTFVKSILKVNARLVTLLFLIFYSLVPKIEIYLKYFLEKNSQKQPLWYITPMCAHQRHDAFSLSYINITPYIRIPFVK